MRSGPDNLPGAGGAQQEQHGENPEIFFHCHRIRPQRYENSVEAHGRASLFGARGSWGERGTRGEWEHLLQIGRLEPLADHYFNLAIRFVFVSNHKIIPVSFHDVRSHDCLIPVCLNAVISQSVTGLSQGGAHAELLLCGKNMRVVSFLLAVDNFWNAQEYIVVVFILNTNHLYLACGAFLQFMKGVCSMLIQSQQDYEGQEGGITV